MLGLTALRNLVALTEKLQRPLVEEKGKVCIPTSSPPPINQSEMTQLWLRLPLTKRHRLLWLLGQLLEHQWMASHTTEENSHEYVPYN